MVPRVFVSSTYYDLKHVRERIESFIENYGFEPVLFESDKVTYQQDKPIDQSAYHEVSLCHIMILIVGGRYGSLSTNHSEQEERTQYDNSFISITRKEFETARQRGIPIIIFIDKSVYGEFQTYRSNVGYFNETNSANFNFAHVDSINVFKFIEHIIFLPIKTFDKVEEIENYLKSQFAGYFFFYLESLKSESDNQKIMDSISLLKNIALRMDTMLTSVGEEVLKDDQGKYEKVIQDQFKIIIDYFIEEFNSSLSLDFSTYKDRIVLKTDFESIVEDLYHNTLEPTIEKAQHWNPEETFARYSRNLYLREYRLGYINDIFHSKVLPFIRHEEDKQFIIKQIAEILFVRYDNFMDLVKSKK